MLRDVLGRVVAEAEGLIVDDDGGTDADGDGIASLAEMQAPNGGDGNGDGLADAFQPAVASYSLAAPGSGVTIELGPGCNRLTGVEAALAEAYPGDPSQRYPFGLTRFVAPDCDAATVRILLHGLPASDCANGTVRKALRRDPATAGAGDWLTVDGALVEPIDLGGVPGLRPQLRDRRRWPRRPVAAAARDRRPGRPRRAHGRGGDPRARAGWARHLRCASPPRRRHGSASVDRSSACWTFGTLSAPGEGGR